MWLLQISDESVYHLAVLVKPLITLLFLVRSLTRFHSNQSQMLATHQMRLSATVGKECSSYYHSEYQFLLKGLALLWK